MKRINVLLSLLSLNAVLVIIERISFTTDIILEPYSFLRLHEVVQITILTLMSIVITFFILKELSHNFETLKSTKGTLLALLFFIGQYFYATGNGLHEVTSHQFNTFCDTKTITSLLCGNMFFNDYYTGNILYFIGLFLSNLSLILLEIMKPVKKLATKNMAITLINSLVLALMFFAYAAFDKVLVGLVYVTISAIIFTPFLLLYRKKLSTLPFLTYTAVTYFISAIATIVVRFT